MKKAKIKTLYSKRLTLRPLQIGDEVYMFKNWSSDSETTKYLSFPTHTSIDEAKTVVERFVKRAENFTQYVFAICENGSDEAIGSISLGIQSEKSNICEIGYVLNKDFWNRGYMTEALNCILKFAFLDVEANRVEALHSDKNMASGKVMENCHMVREGKLRDSYFSPQSGYHDSYIYSILRREFEV